ncbi:hypothetical protein GCM10023170_088420 [Phytohabitans houttuyneae]|uniref:Uncharacterized protein n=1 Tax=Phytohabitans houttuyneae TaxID=1076126 RepID=A0A6V8K597_9ACTN|nr:hypothetical protein Phou_016580 [Phytohabitans houttuyneae]
MPSFAITVFAMFCPAVTLTCDAVGRDSPSGYTVKNVFAVGDTAVTETTTADTPDDGTPPTPVKVNVRVTPTPNVPV